MINDKTGLLENISLRDKVNVELGCGPNKLASDYIGIDIIDYKGVDIVGDVYEVLKLLPNESVDKIYTKHFLEHVNNLPDIVTELGRILKKNGDITIIVPHFSNPYYYSDFSHVQPFGLYSFCYLANDNCGFKRKVPTYKRNLDLDLHNVKLIFMTNPGSLIAGKIKRLITIFANISVYTKELYEEYFCYLIPCYEIIYQLKKSSLNKSIN